MHELLLIYMMHTCVLFQFDMQFTPITQQVRTLIFCTNLRFNKVMHAKYANNQEQVHMYNVSIIHIIMLCGAYTHRHDHV
jgi:hypothetical protein